MCSFISAAAVQVSPLCCSFGVSFFYFFFFSFYSLYKYTKLQYILSTCYIYINTNYSKKDFSLIHNNNHKMRPNSTLSATDSESTMSSAFSDDNEDRDRGEQEDQEDYYYHDTRAISSSAAAASGSNNNKQFFAKLVRDTRSKVEQKTSEINATMQEKLPEWKQRGAMYSKQAKETSIEWSRRGKEAVDRWKKDRAGW